MYALAAAPLPSRIRVAGHTLPVFTVASIAVIAGPIRNESLSTEDALLAQHALVVAIADRVDPLLPARFGTRMTLSQIDTALRPSQTALVEALEHVRGRRQMTVRLFGASAVEQPPPERMTGTAYLAQRRAAAHTMPNESTPLRNAVKRFVVDERIQPGRGSVRATLFHLIARDDIDQYRDAAEDAGAALALQSWSATVTGPWPPFAFAPELFK